MLCFYLVIVSGVQRSPQRVTQLQYITPHDMLAGRQAEIQAAHEAKLAEARQRRAEASKCGRDNAANGKLY